MEVKTTVEEKAVVEVKTTVEEKAAVEVKTTVEEKASVEVKAAVEEKVSVGEKAAVEEKAQTVEEVDPKKDVGDDTDDMIPIACVVAKIDRKKKFSHVSGSKDAMKPCPFCLKSVFSVERIVCGTTGWHKSCLGRK